MSSSPEPPRSDDDAPPDLLDGDRRWGTVGLLFVNLAVGLLMAWVGVPLVVPDDVAGLIAFGAVDAPRVWSGEVWRLLTGCFVHVGAVHLGLNLWVLWQVGRAYERLVGPARVVLVYLVSGIFGFALSTALSPGLTAGASGAIFGLTGALLAVAALTRQQQLGRFLLGALLPFVLATFALGVLAPGFINNVAHGGGLVMGFVLGYGLCAGEPAFMTADEVLSHAEGGAPSSWPQRLGGVALVVAVAGFAAVTLYALQPRWSPRFHAVMGVRDAHDASVARTDADRAEALGRARDHLRQARALGPDDATTNALAARVAEVEGDDATARARMAAALKTWLAAHETRKAALDAALAELALLQPDDEMPYADGFSVRALCDAALDDEGRAVAGPEVKNGCAWLLLRAHEPSVRDPARALPLAREAWIDAKQERPEITHTYADALAQNGAAREGLALLELMAVSGKTGALGGRFIDAERARLGRLADEQEHPTTTTNTTTVSTATAASVDAGTPDGATGGSALDGGAADDRGVDRVDDRVDGGFAASARDAGASNPTQAPADSGSVRANGQSE